MATATNPLPEEAAASPLRVWNRLAWTQAGLITILILVLYGWTLADLANDWWTDPALSQGLLLPPLAIAIAWMRRSLTLSEPVKPDNRGFLWIVTACFLFLLGKLGAEFFLARISFVILLVGLLRTFWGVRRVRTLVFPLLLLATMVPLPALVYNSLAAPLQLFASDVATQLAQLFGVSVYRDGNIINLAHISLGVERACSGLNSLSALMVGGLLLGFLQCTRAVTRIMLFLLTIPLSIAANVVRVTGTAIIADYHEEFALGFYHAFSGWLIFVTGFAALYATSKVLHALFDRKVNA
jgi:exosortase